MENQDTVPKTLSEIVPGTLVHTEWTTFLKKIRPLGSGGFSSVYLAEDPSNGKQYVVKECITSGKNEKIQ